MTHIIGGGPIGLYLAYKLKEQDQSHAVTVYEEHDTIGEPVQCTGLVTSTINKFLKIPPSIIANKISKAQIHAPNRRYIEIKFQEPDLLLYRDRFDRWLEKKATKAGVKIQKGMRLTKIQKTRLLFDKKTVNLNEDEVIVGADGPDSIVARHLGVKHELLQGIQAVMKIHSGKKIKFYPGIGEYAWFVPETTRTARVGIAARKHSKAIFDEFIQQFKGTVQEMQGGLIPLYSIGSKCYDYKDNHYFFLIGDAAGQLKNTTGGGLIPGFRCGEALTDLIINKQHWRYPLSCMMQKELLTHFILHKAMQNFSDEDWNRLIGDFRQKELNDLLSENDREHAFNLALKILAKKPGMITYAKKIL